MSNETFGTCLTNNCDQQAIEPFGFCCKCKTKCKTCGDYSEKQNYPLCLACEFSLLEETKH